MLSTIAKGTDLPFRERLPEVWHQAADIAGLDVETLYAITLVESQRAVSKGSVLEAVPHPYTLRSPYGSRMFQTRRAAEIELQAMIEAGITNIDIGIAQINLHWHGDRVEKPSDLFDIETNLRVAADILAEAGRTAQSLEQQIARYHTWTDVERGSRYSNRVLMIKERLQRL